MPIRAMDTRRRMPRLGKIRIGVMKENNGSRYPKGVDHFVCPPQVLDALKDSAGNPTVPFCEGKCNEERGPVELPVMLLSNEGERVADLWYRNYAASVGLRCKGDGVTADALLDHAEIEKRAGDITQPVDLQVWASASTQKSARVQIDCWGEGYDDHAACPAYDEAKCKRLMMFQFAIIKAPGLGVWQFDTSSIFSIMNVQSFLEFLGTVTGGRIAGIPLVMRVVPQQVAPDGKKKTVYVIELTSPMSLPQIAEAMQKPLAEALLPAPSDEGVGEQFYGEGAQENGQAVGEAAAESLEGTEEPGVVEVEATAVEEVEPTEEPPVDPYDGFRDLKGEPDMAAYLNYSKDHGIDGLDITAVIGEEMQIAANTTPSWGQVKSWVSMVEGRSLKGLVDQAARAKMDRARAGVAAS